VVASGFIRSSLVACLGGRIVGHVGAPALFLEGSPSYYGARGFEQAGRHGFEPAPARTPGAAFQVALLDAHENWMTGRLVYRDVWWSHDSAGLRDPDLADLERRFTDLPD